MLKLKHPNPIYKRDSYVSLNGEWEFSLGEKSYDKKIQVPFSWASPLSGVEEDYKGTGYYRKTVSYEYKNDRLYLVIMAADYETQISVNGVHLTTHLGGYAPIYVDVTAVWKKTEENVIEIAVTDTDETSQTYGKQGYGNIRGIWQNVYLEERPTSFIRDFVIRTKMDGTVSVSTEIDGGFDEISYSFQAPDGTLVSGSSDTKDFTFTVNDPMLWTPDTPNLYEGSICVQNNGKSDEVFTYFGIREVSSIHMDNGYTYVALNGKPIYINSTLDQSYNPKGFFTLESDEECENEILRLKALGLNSARIHIKTEEPLKLYYADKHGIMIIQDIPCFWGEPTEETKKLFDVQMIECMKRDMNHPSIIQWVLYNETWGLFSGEGEERTYKKETQKWVVENYYKAKELDPTRLVEDNSPCNKDHTVTDINTYHFYTNGYKEVQNVIREYASKSYPGSTFNFAEGYCCPDIPHMNSECGDVWGIDGSAGDSDLSWHYKYMMNEFRLQENNSGFIFTEFHDVINEFNGYYRIDNSKKIFGFDSYVPGMSMKDLHAQNFLCYDAPPMTTLAYNEEFEVPLYLSSFAKKKDLSVKVEAAALLSDGTVKIVDTKEFPVEDARFGLIRLPSYTACAPNEEAVLTVRLYLLSEGKIIMRNFVNFDVTEKCDEISLDSLKICGNGFICQEGYKLNALSDASVSFEFEGKNQDMTLQFEASSRETFTKDYNSDDTEDKGLDWMLGYKVDRGANPNCFFMTTEGQEKPSTLSVYLNEKKISEILLPDDPADSRGCLSWHYQKSVRLLDEAGTYGELYKVTLPKEELKKKNTITLKATDGFSLFNRKSGRYPAGLNLL